MSFFSHIAGAKDSFVEEKPQVDAADQKAKDAASAAKRRARAASDDVPDDDEGRDPTVDPLALPAPPADDDDDEDISIAEARVEAAAELFTNDMNAFALDDDYDGGGGGARVTASLVKKACTLLASFKANQAEPAELVAGGRTLQTGELFKSATGGLATICVYALVSIGGAPTSQEWPIRVYTAGGKLRNHYVQFESGPAFGTKTFFGGSYDTPAHAIFVKDLALARQYALAAHVGMCYLLCDPAARDVATIAAYFVDAFAQTQIPAHEADGFDAYAKLPLAVGLGRASLADVKDAEVAAFKKTIADAYPAALVAAENALQRRWLKGRSLVAGEMAANALETGARAAILACTAETVDAAGHVVRVALVDKPGPYMGPHPVLFAFYRYLCTPPCAPQVYVSDRLKGLAVTVTGCEVEFRWGAGKKIHAGTFASPDAAEIVGRELEASPTLRTLVAGGTFMANEDDTSPAAQAAALGRAESDMRCILSDGMVAGMASLRFKEGSDEHQAMVDAVKRGRPAPAVLKDEHDFEWRSMGRLTPEKAAAKIAEANALAASIPDLREHESPELDSILVRLQNINI